MRHRPTRGMVMYVVVLCDCRVRGARQGGASELIATLWLPLIIIGGFVKNLRAATLATILFAGCAAKG